MVRSKVEHGERRIASQRCQFDMRGLATAFQAVDGEDGLTLRASVCGTRYAAIARQADREKRAQHEAMGFHGGWGAALDQLVAAMKG